MSSGNGKLSIASSTERVKTWLEGQVLHIRFNNPARHNALSLDMWEAVPHSSSRRSARQRAHGRILGEGDKAFVSGADISQFEDLRAQKEAVKRYEQLAEAALQGIYEFAKPTIACHSRLLHRGRRERCHQLRPSRGGLRLGFLDPRHAASDLGIASPR
jgi:hypothetical protein